MLLDGLGELPNSWLVVVLFLGLVILRAIGIDSFTTAGISMLIGYVTGKHIQQTTQRAVNVSSDK